MLTKDGHLFHIDFAHFLGNIMKWKGIKRERAPFVFTPEFLFVLGGEKSPMFQQFVHLCCLAYNLLREEHQLFINQFALVKTCIPFHISDIITFQTRWSPLEFHN